MLELKIVRGARSGNALPNVFMSIMILQTSEYMLTLKEFDTLVFGFKLHSLFELSGNEGMALAK